MDADKIYWMLRDGGLSRAGALGMLGNMMAESGLKETIVQRGMTKLSDEQYVAAVDNGLYDFVDGIGFGLYQLTYGPRKAGYLAYCKAQDCSIGDGAAQIEYCLYELTTDYPILYNTLCTSDDINRCSDLICTQFERPAVNNLEARRAYAHQFESTIVEDKNYTKEDAISATFPKDPTVLNFQLYLNYNGYETPVTGYKSESFFNTLEQFVQDMKTC